MNYYSYYCPKCLKRSLTVVRKEHKEGAWYYHYRCRSCGYEFTKKRFHMRLITVHLPQFYIDAVSYTHLTLPTKRIV